MKRVDKDGLTLTDRNELNGLLESTPNAVPSILSNVEGSDRLKKDTSANSDSIVTMKTGSCQVLSFEKWDCVVKKVLTTGVRVYATDSSHFYTSRYFTFRKEYFERKSKESIQSLYEGQRLEWVIKRIRSSKGQEIKIEEINIYRLLKLPEWQLKIQVEQQLKELELI